MPAVVQNAWKEIWNMNDKQFGAPRQYFADFEVYDERVSNHAAVVLDIFIGIKDPS